MAAKLQELCTILVEDACGHLCSQIFSTLAENGRLSRAQLQHLTRTRGKQLRRALVVLLQQHLVLCYTSEGGVTHYQADWRNSYYLVRSNRMRFLVDDRYGAGAAKIVGNLLQLGHARIGDLAKSLDLEDPTKRDSGVECNGQRNGEGDAKTNGSGPTPGKITTFAQFHNTIRTLLRAGFLCKFGKRNLAPAADLQAEIEEVIISEHFPDRKVTGPKKQAEFKTAVNNLKRKWRDAEEFSEHRDLDSRGAGTGGFAKRAKINGGMSNGYGGNGAGEPVAKLPNEMIVAVNFDRCVLALRSHRLEQMAESYFGPVTAHVYGALLRILEGRVKANDRDAKEFDPEDEDEELDLPSATTAEVGEILDPSIDLTQSIQGAAEIYKSLTSESRPKKKRKPVNNEFADIGIKQEVISDSEDEDQIGGYQQRQQRLHLIDEHLKLLQEHHVGFCRKIGNAGGGEWRVNFPALTDTLVHTDIDSVILARFSKTHIRIIRLLRERGRLEEKQVAAFSMMRVKDVRTILTELQFAGLVEAQELPKDAGRVPGRTLYLWAYNPTRVSSLLLQQTYQAMARTLTRLRVERENYKGAIEKANMIGPNQEALSQMERETLMQWREMEEKLLVQVQRMDEFVALLRDFSGKDTSLIS